MKSHRPSIKPPFHRYRIVRFLVFALAAAPLFQLQQCSTLTRQSFAGLFNALPATIFSINQGFLLAPLQALLSGGNSTNTSP